MSPEREVVRPHRPSWFPGTNCVLRAGGNPPPYRYPPQCPRPHHHTTPTHRHHTHLSTAPTDHRNEHYAHPATTPVPPESAAQRTSDKQGHTGASRFEPPADPHVRAHHRARNQGYEMLSIIKIGPTYPQPPRKIAITPRTPRHTPRTAGTNRPTHAGQAWTDRRAAARTLPSSTTRSTYPEPARPRPVARTGPHGVRGGDHYGRDGGRVPGCWRHDCVTT